MPAPVWDGVTTQLALLSYLHMAAFILILLVTCMRSSELLALRKKDIVPPLAPLLPWWSIVIAASEAGASTKTGIRDGLVQMDQRYFRRVSKLLPALNVGNPEAKSWNFDYLAAAKMFKTATDIWRLSGMTYTKTSQWSRHRSGARFQHPARSAKTRSVAPRSPWPASKQAGNTRATCRGIVDNATLSPAVHKRMTGKYQLDVFGGSGFLTKATNNPGLRGHVLDTKFGPRYDVTQPLVLTRSRQDVSARKCVAGMISPPRHHMSCSPKIMSASDAIASLLRRAPTPWILEHPCDSWFWHAPKIEALAVQPHTAWALAHYCRKQTWFLVGNVDRRDQHRIARRCAGTGGRCSVSGQKH